jgi:pimeloyl-ACP methyl ester carboxylesterase
VSLVLVEPPHHDVEAKMSEDVIKKVLADWKADYKGNVEKMTREHLFIPTSDEKIVQSVVQRMTAVQPFIGRAMIASLFRYDFARAMEEVHVPMHFINSSAMGPTDVAMLERHSKHVDLQVIDGVGHFPMLEAPAKFDAALDAAIAGEVPASKSAQ